MFYKFLINFRVQAFIVVLLSLLLYGNTLRNTYAMDDDLIILKNLNVQKGFSGIKKILTTDAFQGYMDMMVTDLPLLGGRYRPLSIVTFAIEQQLFGETHGEEYATAQKELIQQQRQNVSVEKVTALLKQKDAIEASMLLSNLKITTQRHLIQILFFALSMLVVLYFLTHYVFRSYPLLGFFTVLLFIAHPVHTEVVANLKSRDEIFSLLFIALTGIYCFRYQEERTNKNLWLCLLCFLGALLSKEYAMVLPFVLAAGLYTLYAVDFNKVFNPCIKGMFILLFLFTIIRFSAFHKSSPSNVKQDVLNAPYLFASPAEKIASKVSIVLQYARVLIYPKHLSYDYSYNQLPYVSFSSWEFGLSIVLYGTLFYLTWYFFKRRHVLGFALIFFFSFFLLINNLIFGIGATMGERLIYHSSLGFCMAIVWLVYAGFEKIKLSGIGRQLLVGLLCIGILTPLAAKTISRNETWQSDYILDTTDVETVSESAAANNNAGSVMVNKVLQTWALPTKKTPADSAALKATAKKALLYFEKAVRIHPVYFNSTMNMGLCYFYLNDFEKAAFYLSKAATLYDGPQANLRYHSRLFVTRGLQFGYDKNYPAAIIELQRATSIYPYDADVWNNLGGSLYMAGRYKESKAAFEKSLEINPYLVDSENGKKAAEYNLLQETSTKEVLK
ncbi:MAG: hypothetical protein JWO58_2205 [Chitinophagaceae bacterium]|nr:hypothetical protein [Chitinophagaceae bacterium]